MRKGGKIPFQKLLKKLDPALPGNILYIMFSLDLHPFLPGSFSGE